MAEQDAVNVKVVGSSPTPGAIKQSKARFMAMKCIYSTS